MASKDCGTLSAVFGLILHLTCYILLVAKSHILNQQGRNKLTFGY